jgi:starch-binding outer membrane protein, SusD/RagB family
MKRIFSATAALGLLAGLSSCIDLDEKLITGVSSQYYATPEGLNSALISAYGQLRNYYGREQLISLAQVGTDTWMDADQAGSNNREFGQFNGGLNSQVVHCRTRGIPPTR